MNKQQQQQHKNTLRRSLRLKKIDSESVSSPPTASRPSDDFVLSTEHGRDILTVLWNNRETIAQPHLNVAVIEKESYKYSKDKDKTESSDVYLIPEVEIVIEQCIFSSVDDNEEEKEEEEDEFMDAEDTFDGEDLQPYLLEGSDIFVDASESIAEYNHTMQDDDDIMVTGVTTTNNESMIDEEKVWTPLADEEEVWIPLADSIHNNTVAGKKKRSDCVEDTEPELSNKEKYLIRKRKKMKKESRMSGLWIVNN